MSSSRSSLLIGYSIYQDDSDHPLEAQWFYVPERDSDQERAMLIRSMMPRPGKRSETKKYKQYYYRPLEKISRWDGEDDI
jgi:lipoprotein NlpI